MGAWVRGYDVLLLADCCSAELVNERGEVESLELMLGLASQLSLAVGAVNCGCFHACGRCADVARTVPDQRRCAVRVQKSTKAGSKPEDVAAAQALADIATIAIVQHRTAVDTQLLNQQLTEALTSRIVIEQAKGMIGERRQLPMDQAFALLRHHARRNNLRLVIEGAPNSDGDSRPSSMPISPNTIPFAASANATG